MSESPANKSPARIIIVLGGQNDVAGKISPMTQERATRAIELLRCTPHARLLLTGGYGHFNSSTQPHAYHLSTFIIDQGVDPGHFLPFVLSANTVEDAVFSARALRGFVLSGIDVATSQIHVARAQLVFEHFFDPALLHFHGAPDAAASDVLLRHAAHEQAAIEQIRMQGGVLFEGQLHTRRAPAAATVR
jgi:uncharacterized SAM-binding protein YcdF (DUF218 family)